MEKTPVIENKVSIYVKNSYEEYWNTIYKIIKKNRKKSLKTLWLIITCHELHLSKELRTNTKFSKKVVYKYGKKYPINTIKEIQDNYDFSLKPFLNLMNTNKFECVIEFGSGWGRNLFYYFLHNVPTTIDYYAFELTQCGVNSTNLLKRKITNYNLFTDTFDINSSEIKLNKEYDNILVSTFHSIEQITVVNPDFFDKILKLNSNVTGIHVEPIGWQIDDETKLKYNQSDRKTLTKPSDYYYNTNLFSVLQKLEQENRIKIKRIEIDFFNFFTANCGTLLIWEKIN